VYTFFLTLLILDSLFLCLVVLLQSGKGGGLAAEFGGVSSSTDTFLGGRQAATLLTKLSWWSGGVFIVLALILTILSADRRSPGSILEGQFGPTTTEQAPTPLLDREQTQEGPGEEAGAAGQSSGQSQPPPEGEP
jgi:preprotein translocase subunit SecG